MDDLLEVSRITRGVIDVQREPLDLAFVLRAAIETSRPAIEAARHELTVELPAEPITVAGDAVRLTQVFANLLTNAAKYTNAGGHIWLTVTTRGRPRVVSVRDNGIGIPPDQLASVFDMFTQVDRSNRRAQGGLGIGLTLVRSLVDDARRRGSRPAALGSARAASSSSSCRSSPHAGRRTARRDRRTRFPPRRILVVDDNRDAAETLGALLTHARRDRLRRPQRPRRRSAALEAFDPDAVLLDIGMPEMDGYEVVAPDPRDRRSRRHPADRADRMGPGTGSATGPARPASTTIWSSRRTSTSCVRS